MPRSETYRRSPLLWYHALVAGLTMFAGLTLMSVGIFLKVVDPMHNFKLSFTANDSFNEYFTVAYLGIFTGIILILISAVGVCAVRVYQYRVLILTGYTLLCISTIISLGFLSVVWLNVARGNFTQFALEGRLHKAWQNTVVLDKKVVCDIQRDFQCFGFRRGDCAVCPNSVMDGTLCERNPLDCPVCEKMSKNSSLTDGCFDAIVEKLKSVHTPAGITCATVAGMLVIDMVFVYAL
ncbi:unnamed protein product [Agarophyton chilense]